MTYLGIEIGGTKLQVGVGPGDRAELLALARGEVDPAGGAEGILEAVAALARPLLAAHRPRACGVGFGGPIDAAAGQTVKSHHVRGWENKPLVEWCRQTLGLPAILGNDADLAGLAEARFGAGRGCNPVFYLTIGTGIGGGLIVDGQIYRGAGRGAAELGHLRPGLNARDPADNLESLAAGWGIAARARRRLETRGAGSGEPSTAALFEACGGDAERLTAQHVAAAAAAGDRLAREIFEQAVAALAWGIAQMITLTAPQIVVIGGGVSLAGEELLFAPLRRGVQQYVFPPFRGGCQLVPAALGEEMVVYGALALAAQSEAP